METETYLTFILGTEYFAVSVDNVLEVLERQQITPVPEAPLHLMGIINFRGEILSVINMHFRFDLPLPDENELERLLIVIETKDNNNNYTIAATADKVKDVIVINPELIKPLPEVGIKYNTQYIKGTCKVGEHFIMIIKTEKVFALAEQEQVYSEMINNN